MLDARFSRLYFGPTLNTLLCGLPAIAGLLVYVRYYHCTACTVYLHCVHVRLLRVTLNINQSTNQYPIGRLRIISLKSAQPALKIPTTYLQTKDELSRSRFRA